MSHWSSDPQPTPMSVDTILSDFQFKVILIYNTYLKHVQFAFFDVDYFLVKGALLFASV
jgi:hypothetical protein